MREEHGGWETPVDRSGRAQDRGEGQAVQWMSLGVFHPCWDFPWQPAPPWECCLLPAKKNEGHRWGVQSAWEEKVKENEIHWRARCKMQQSQWELWAVGTSLGWCSSQHQMPGAHACPRFSGKSPNPTTNLLGDPGQATPLYISVSLSERQGDGWDDPSVV